MVWGLNPAPLPGLLPFAWSRSPAEALPLAFNPNP
jgi:hypothetical protein